MCKTAYDVVMDTAARDAEFFGDVGQCAVAEEVKRASLATRWWKLLESGETWVVQADGTPADDTL